MSAKHTPGPWTHEGFGVWSHVNGENRRVACSEFDRGDGPYKVKTEAEAVANAALISAAPDLLEACKALMRHMEPPALPGDARTLTGYALDYRAAKSAIAKAEGR